MIKKETMQPVQKESKAEAVTRRRRAEAEPPRQSTKPQDRGVRGAALIRGDKSR